MTNVVFLDTETTSLRHDRRTWDIGLIVRDAITVKHPNAPDTCQSAEHSWFIHADDLDLGNADPMSLKIGRFHDRHPNMNGAHARYEQEAVSEKDALTAVERLTRGAHIAGMVPNFDTEVLASRMRAHGICPSWHYHLIDVEALAIGYLHSSAAYGKSPSGKQQELTGSITALPWNSEALSRALGVDPDEFDRHTALGDARWTKAIYERITS